MSILLGSPGVLDAPRAMVEDYLGRCHLERANIEDHGWRVLTGCSTRLRRESGLVWFALGTCELDEGRVREPAGGYLQGWSAG